MWPWTHTVYNSSSIFSIHHPYADPDPAVLVLPDQEGGAQNKTEDGQEGTGGVTRWWCVKSQKDSERRWLQAAGTARSAATLAVVGLGTAFTILPANFPPLIVNPRPPLRTYIYGSDKLFFSCVFFDPVMAQ